MVTSKRMVDLERTCRELCQSGCSHMSTSHSRSPRIAVAVGGHVASPSRWVGPGCPIANRTLVGRRRTCPIGDRTKIGRSVPPVLPRRNAFDTTVPLGGTRAGTRVRRPFAAAPEGAPNGVGAIPKLVAVVHCQKGHAQLLEAVEIPRLQRASCHTIRIRGGCVRRNFGRDTPTGGRKGTGHRLHRGTVNRAPSCLGLRTAKHTGKHPRT